jgi:hypothetical protein
MYQAHSARPSPWQTYLLSPMSAQKLASALSSERDGEPGGSSPLGTNQAQTETLAGLKQSAFTSWLRPSQSYSQKENISGSLETTWASSKDGGKGGVATDPPTKSSSWLTSSATNQTAFSTRSTFPLSSTPQTAPQCYVPQPYASPASICQSIHVCVSPILVLL